MYTPACLQVQGLCSGCHNLIRYYRRVKRMVMNLCTCINVKPHYPSPRHGWGRGVVVLNTWWATGLNCMCTALIPHTHSTKWQTCQVPTLQISEHVTSPHTQVLTDPTWSGADPGFVVEGWLKKDLLWQGKWAAKILLINYTCTSLLQIPHGSDMAKKQDNSCDWKYQLLTTAQETIIEEQR